MSQKKRALSGSNGTPEAYGLSSNEMTEDEELANEKLEVSDNNCVLDSFSSFPSIRTSERKLYSGK